MAKLNIKDLLDDNCNVLDNNNDPESVEDGIIKDSVLKLTSNTFDEISPDEFVGAKLRNFNVASQNDIEEEYKGKTVSRKSLLKNDSESDSSNGDYGESVLDEDDIDDNSSVIEGSYLVSGDSDTDSDSSFIDDDIDSAVDGSKRNNVIGELKKPRLRKDETRTKNNEANDYEIYSKTQNVVDDISKGNAVRHQILIWESLLECRIKLQKALIASNKLPQFDNFSSIKSSFSENDHKKVSATCKNITALLQLLLPLQKDMIKCYPEFRRSSNRINESSDINDGSDDESISSSIVSGDEIESGTSTKDKNGDGLSEPPKKMRKLEDFSNELHQQHLEFIPARNEAIQKWNDKTRISSGRFKSSNFSAFDQSTLKQIEQILCEKDRLIKRTQTKRSMYNILGKIDNLKESDQDAKYDPEIFDDDDFYHKLLREFIEQKSVDVTNPQLMGKQWVELQKMRSKMKRPIDVKATKGRRLRYTTHSKLVNFMAPIPYNSWTDEAESELFSSLFGEIKQK
ncbi:apoptosis antagonizing transcription factor [Lycorma delicatula]|uniref:apoptosis antagonizing transcription factor n=1 Tax=Lycorma delicatula TaxID=130591 RepID=UPI003F51454B